VPEHPSFQTFVNAEGQYAIAPTTWPPAEGWTAVGPPGPEATCSAYVQEHWTDMCPRSVRDTPNRRSVT
jgi:MbtH protein